MTTRQSELEISNYLVEWYSARYPDWSDFLKSEDENKKNGIYRLPQGGVILDFLRNLVENIGCHFCCDDGKHIIPSRFSSINQLLQYLLNFKMYTAEKYSIIESQFNGSATNYVIAKIAEICSDITAMVSRCCEVYLESDSVPIPYVRARQCLFENNIARFIDIMNSLIASIPYNVQKEKVNEGYFHTFFHVICSVIGLSPESEVETSDGRIDMYFECPKHIFIFEFKYSDKDKNMSEEALNQIKKKNYSQKYHVQCKPIYGVGVSFSGMTRGINGHRERELYIPEYQPK